MKPEAISDQKRLVRAEHWLRARYFLRARDGVHHRPWKILTVAGPSPHEEIACIRELMPKASIVAVDINEANVMAAIEAGADDAFVCDLSAFEQERTQYGNYIQKPPKPFAEAKFDAICLDFTGPADDWLRHVISAYYTNALLAQGVMIVTFSYGRDVVERMSEEWKRKEDQSERGVNTDYRHKVEAVPEIIACRLWYVLRSRIAQLDSCLRYRGNRMPMISCLLAKKSGGLPPATFMAIGEEDYRLAVTSENLGNVYACPADRIVELRRRDTRSLAAQKAVQTRLSRKREVPLLTYQPED